MKAVVALALLFALAPSRSAVVSPALQPSAQVRPLPDSERFYRETRANLERSQGEQFRFAYKERRTELHTNPFGRLGSGGTVGYEVTPEEDGTVRVRRLIERDGQPVTDGGVERVDLRRGEERRGRSRPSVWEDTVKTLQMTIDRREMYEGRPVIVVLFEPRPDARPETREGRLARVFKGSILVDEVAHEVVRVDATAIDSISIGMGLVARINEGSTVTLRREPVDGSTWMPTSIRFTGRGRALLFRRLNVNHVIEWFDYRRVLGPASIGPGRN
jgi:hypothetical protein